MKLPRSPILFVFVKLEVMNSCTLNSAYCYNYNVVMNSFLPVVRHNQSSVNEHCLLQAAHFMKYVFKNILSSIIMWRLVDLRLGLTTVGLLGKSLVGVELQIHPLTCDSFTIKVPQSFTSLSKLWDKGQ